MPNYQKHFHLLKKKNTWGGDELPLYKPLGVEESLCGRGICGAKLEDNDGL